MFTNLKRPASTGIAPVPLKRRKSENTENYLTDVKGELSPSPPPLIAPRTSGTRHVGLPDLCQKTNPAWKENRKRWIAAEINIVRELGLQVVKNIIRDDGMAIDWQSDIPVDPLTLRPPPPVRSKSPSHLPGPSIPSSSPSTPFITAQNSTVDFLGHALRDQTAVACQPVPSPPLAPFLEERSRSSPRDISPTTIGNSSADIAVVGAALLKEHPPSILEKTSDPSGQTQHRKLLPLELRAKYKGIKEKRKAWINSQIETVEGYTGEKYVGYRYDGNYVVITVGRKKKPWSNRTGHERNSESQQGLVDPRKDGGHQHRPDRWDSSQRCYNGNQPRSYNQWNNSRVPDAHRWAILHDRNRFPHQIYSRLPEQHEQDSTDRPYASYTPGHSDTHVVSVQDKREQISMAREDAAQESSKQVAPSASSMISESRQISVDTRCRTTPGITHEISHMENPSPPEQNWVTVKAEDDIYSLQYPSGDFPSRQEPSPVLEREADEAPLQIESLKAKIDVPPSLSEDGQKADVLGLAFLMQFMHAFDTDRHSLVDAYSPNASLLLTDDFTTLVIGGHSPHTVTRVGPDAIVKTLQCIDSEVQHSPVFSRTVTMLDDMDPGGLLVTFQGMLLPRQAVHAHDILFSHIFVLMKNRGPNPVIWPLQIVSDNLTLRRQRR